MKTLLYLVVGVVLGVSAACTFSMNEVPNLMIAEDESPLDQAATVAALQQAAKERGWKVPTVHHLHKSLAKMGHQVEPVSVIALCQPEHAAKLLKDDAARVVTSMMPCRISVYRKADGEVMISRMNSGLMSRFFGAPVSEVMQQAAAETEEIVQSVLKNG